MEIGQCRACGNSAEWCAAYTGCPLNKGKAHLPYKPEGVHPDVYFGVPQKDKIEVCPKCGCDYRKYIGDNIPFQRRLTAYSWELFCSAPWHDERREKHHAFEWYNLGEGGNVVGASVKEAREILKEGLEMFIGCVYGSHYFPGLFPADYYAKPKLKRSWWARP